MENGLNCLLLFCNRLKAHAFNIDMTPAIHYVIKGKTIHLMENNKMDFIEVSRKFTHASPIVAREAAFNEYQNCIEQLLKNEGEQYVSDRQSRVSITSFYEPGNKSNIKIADQDIEFGNTFGNGIGVYMVVENPVEDVFDDKKGDEYLIHGIGQLVMDDKPQNLMSALNHEYAYYEYFRYDMKTYRVNAVFYEYDIQEAESNRILKTPFDWSGFDRPYAEALKNMLPEVKHYDIGKLIITGEGHQVNFKPNLLFNHKTGKGGISIKAIIAKTIAGFLNADGGILFIGLTDKKLIQGIGHDYSLANGKAPQVFFRLEFDQMVEHFLTMSVKSNISGEFLNIEGQDIFIVTVFPNKKRPIFLNGQEDKEFYVRGDLSTKRIFDIEEIARYCINRWGRANS